MTADADEPITDLVRQRLRSLRQAAGYSLDALGERCGLSASSISRIETGKRSIDLDTLVALAREAGAPHLAGFAHGCTWAATAPGRP